jgi:hypothetical protein
MQALSGGPCSEQTESPALCRIGSASVGRPREKTNCLSYLWTGPNCPGPPGPLAGIPAPAACAGIPSRPSRLAPPSGQLLGRVAVKEQRGRCRANPAFAPLIARGRSTNTTTGSLSCARQTCNSHSGSPRLMTGSCWASLAERTTRCVSSLGRCCSLVVHCSFMRDVTQTVITGLSRRPLKPRP